MADDEFQERLDAAENALADAREELGMANARAAELEADAVGTARALLVLADRAVRAEVDLRDLRAAARGVAELFGPPGGDDEQVLYPDTMVMEAEAAARIRRLREVLDASDQTSKPAGCLEAPADVASGVTARRDGPCDPAGGCPHRIDVTPHAYAEAQYLCGCLPGAQPAPSSGQDGSQGA